MRYVSDKALLYQQYLNRENEVLHHTYDDELMVYHTMQAGDLKCVELGLRLFTLAGRVSRDPLNQMKYNFVAMTTLATRFAIEANLDESTAYVTSDLYIQQLENCKDVDAVISLYREMLTSFTKKIAALKKAKVYSKPVVLCMDYIYNHLHEKITLCSLAQHSGVSPSYLSALFKRDVGISVSEYITQTRMETARNMVLHSDIKLSEIAAILAFSSQSYFIKVFHSTYGFTPKEYRTKFFRIGLDHS